VQTAGQVAQVAVVAVAVDKTLQEDLVETDLHNSSIKMYAIVLDNVVIGPLVANNEELKQIEKEYPKHKFIEMTEKNSPAITGEIWKGE
jgi:hypothetical protein